MCGQVQEAPPLGSCCCAQEMPHRALGMPFSAVGTGLLRLPVLSACKLAMAQLAAGTPQLPREMPAAWLGREGSLLSWVVLPAGGVRRQGAT